MHILFLSELFHPHGGGAEIATYWYAKMLSETGHKVTVVTNRYGNEQERIVQGNLTVFRLPLFKSETGVKYAVLSRIDIALSRPMKKLVEQATVIYIPRLWYSMIPVAKASKKPVIVHLHDYTPLCPLAVLYDSSKKKTCENRNFCSVKCIYTSELRRKFGLKNSIISTLMNFAFRQPLRKLVEQANALVCVSEAQKVIFMKYLPRIRNRTFTIYNPLPDIPPVKIAGDGFGYFGGFNLLKGYEILRNALAHLHDPSLEVHVTGLPVVDERLAKCLIRLGIFLHQKLSYGRQEEFYRAIKGVVFPSIVNEPLPYVTAEALLRARVLIASNVGGIPEQVRDCKGAYLFTSGDFRELAEKMNFVNSLSREVASNLGAQNREVFTTRFKNEKTLKDFSKLLNEVACVK